MGTAGGRVAGKVAFVTGAGSGIGRATALLLGREGASVVIADIDTATGLETEALCHERGIDARFVRADITDQTSVDAAVAAAVDAFGRIDVLHNCAGGSLPNDAPITEVDPAVWDFTIGVNVRGAMNCCRAVIPHMTSGASSIVNMSSFAGLSGGHPFHIYAAAKGAIISFTRTLANAYAARGIRANAIAPGMVLSDRMAARWDDTAAAAFRSHPFSVGRPDDIAAIVLFLASDESRMINGTTIAADGGLTAY